MELKELEKQRDAYAGRIGKLALQIAVIFAVPVAIALGLWKYFDISLMYLFPVAFIVSWTLVISLYRRVDKRVRELESKIRDLKKEEHNKN